MKLSPQHEAARQHIAVDIGIIPIEENGKRPVTPNGLYDSTICLTKIDEIWGKNPHYNLATCPADSGLFVVDVDPGADPAIIEKLKQTATYWVRTPRGGYHFYFLGTGPSTVGKLAPHVDTKSIGGYVLLPGSVINGKTYTVENEADYAPIPDWVIEALATSSTPVKSAVEEEDLECNIERARARLEHLVATGDVAIEDKGGDERTYRLCCELLDLGVSVHTGIELLQKIWIPHCTPCEASDDWLETKFNNALAYKHNENGAYAVEPAAQVFKDVVENLHTTAQNEEAAKPFIYVRDRVTQLNSPAPEMQVEIIQPARKPSFIIGEKGHGKTYTGLEIVTAICMDRPAFGRFKVRQPGIVIAFLGEDSREAEHCRLTAIEQYYGRSLQGLLYTVENAIPLDDPNLRERYFEEVRRVEKRVGKIASILDETLKRSTGSLNPNDAETGNIFSSVAEGACAEFGCSFICSAHPPKNGGSEVGIAGTGSFVDNVSVTLNVARKTEKPFFDIECSFEPKYRIGPRPEPFIIRGTPVELPSPVAGVTHDLVFTALSDDQVQRAAERGGVLRAEHDELQRVLDTFHAHSLATGLTTRQLAEGIVGDPKHFKDDDDYRQRVGKAYSRLDNGTRGKKQRNGKESRPRYEAWFEKDFRTDTKGVTKWWCHSPAERAAAAQEQEAPCR